MSKFRAKLKKRNFTKSLISWFIQLLKMMACITTPEPGLSKSHITTGQIQVIFGPMFSGKTTELMRRLKRYQLANYRCLIIKYSKDTRYDDNGIATHDSEVLPATGATELSSLLDSAVDYDVIGVDEGQFFPDVVSFCELMADRGKTVVVAALDGTYQRQGFADILRLVPLAESVVKLTAVCMQCYGEASFTKRKGQETQVEVIGGAEKYLAVCRACHKEPGQVSPMCSPRTKGANPTGSLHGDKINVGRRLFGTQITNTMEVS